MTITTRRSLLAAALMLAAHPAGAAGPDFTLLARGLAMADATPDLRTLIISHGGTRVAERTWRGATLTRPTNIKSASRTIVATLAGIAAARGLFTLDDRIAPILGRLVPPDVDPRVRQLTIRHLLSMRAGLRGTSGANYGRWVSSRNWLSFALSRPFVDEPGGGMIYSTANSTRILIAKSQILADDIKGMTEADGWSWVYSNAARRREKSPAICFTGFSQGEKDDLLTLAVGARLRVVESVNKGLLFLCAGNPGPSKLVKAREYGVAVLSESDFLVFLESVEIPVPSNQFKI